ncbi:ADP-ribosylglycohydrolase family protein [Dactylosporangium vinaceum]|uniref:ADP-ribosylglycohydrolase family protein n=1 Tax=Dactylosporangium vinaceum TaxID=53362 RepID=A0ABV5M093_9ACTN|nr:ADP-ribosylglycohydrolase family protein [Dactylosporangium vinaceum]UAB98199.1 ADP-ribosylglycohydrolase family protein [Dactylosporangium vinaceum]
MSKVKASLFGLAFGDALGYPVEFQTFEQITATFGRRGPRDLPPRPLVSDDTQMTLAVGDALVLALAEGPLQAARLEPHLSRLFVEWARSPENNRAPGTTCMAACDALQRGLPWWKATVAGSKGCGANMRVAPMALVPGLSEDERAGAAQLQAAITHGHPTGLAASELTALTIRWLLDGLPVAELLPALRDRCASQRSVYRADWLGDDLWRQPMTESAEQFIARGWDECLAALTGLEDQVRYLGPDADPCAAGGAGWIAEEALATALYCLLLFPDSPVDVIARAAASSGDSDSIACLAGSFAGAAGTASGWPADWYERIEYKDHLDRLATAWSA